MKLEKLEIWVHDNILKNDKIRHFLYAVYQRSLYLVSKKTKYTGDVKTITPNDEYEYFFGYYDKSPWDKTEKYMLALRVKSATKNADSSEIAEIVTIDLENNNKVKQVATTNTWNVQQACMLQWFDDNSILYNDFVDGKYCSVILNLKTNEKRIIDMPVYTMSSDKKVALSLDFSRLHRLRKGYGYCNLEEETKLEKCPKLPCLWKIDMETNEVTAIKTYSDFYSFETKPSMIDAEHKINHLMLSPNGKRFMVLHRWFKNNVKYTRLVTCNVDGSEMYNLSDDDFVSHCCWKKNEEILSYLNKKDGGKGYYLMKDKTAKYEKLWDELAMDGHPSYSPSDEFVVTDTYPDRKRMQSLYVMQQGKVKTIAKVFSPFKYKGDVRCDLHPRWNYGGNKICFDASFNGKRSICVMENVKF